MQARRAQFLTAIVRELDEMHPARPGRRDNAIETAMDFD
jgi:hypothetical protein